MNRIYTTDQLAKRWCCSRNTVRNAVLSGNLSAFRVGRLIRIPQEAVEAFEKRH